MAPQKTRRTVAITKTIALLFVCLIPCVAGPARSVTPVTGLSGQRWHVQELNHSSVNLGSYWIIFDNDSIARCSMACNTAEFGFSSRADSIRFIFRTISLAVCLSTSREEEFVSTLEKVTRATVVGHSIYLQNDTDTLLVCADIAPSPLVGSTWILDSLNHSAENIKGCWLKCISDTSATVRMPCNTCSYRYQVRADTISFTPRMCTIVACLGPNREDELEEAMRTVTRWQRTATRLLLLKTTDTLMTFADSTAMLLTKQPWRLQYIAQASGRATVETPEHYTAVFGNDGSLRAGADCNTCNGTFFIGGEGRLRVDEPLGCTKMNCGPGSLGENFVGALNRTLTYTIRSDTLWCVSSADTLCFTASSTAIHRPSSKSSAAGISIHRAGNAFVAASNIGPISSVRIFNARGVCVGKVEGCGKNRVVVPMESAPAGVYLAAIRVLERSGARVIKVRY